MDLRASDQSEIASSCGHQMRGRNQIPSPVLSSRAVPPGDPSPESGKEADPAIRENRNLPDVPLTMNAVVVGKPSQLPPSRSGGTRLNPRGGIEDGHREQQSHTTH